jgi:small conductance mechanosensitive channel
MMTMSVFVQSLVAQIDVESIVWHLQRLVIVAAIVAVTWITTKIVGSFISKALGLVSPKMALQVRRITSVMIWLIGIIATLDQLGLDTALLLMIIAMVGLIAVTAYRDILPSMASYDLITTYDLFKIGDWIEVEEHFGRVVNITWMNTVLLTRDNEMIYVPNSRIIRGNLVNRTVQGGIRVSVPLTLDRSLALPDVERVLLEVGAEMGETLVPDFKPEVRLTHVDERTLKVELLLRIRNPAREAFIASEVRKRALKKLEEANKPI